MKAMKNETVTLSRGLAEAAANYMEGSASHTVITWCKEIRAALAEPVPPSGGDSSQTKIKPVFMLRAERLWGKDGEYAVTTEDHEWVNGCRKVGGDFPVYSGEAVTRLQAEVTEQALWAASESRRAVAAEAERDALQAELTKARECLSTANDKLRRQDIASQYKDGQIAKHDGELAMLQSELTKARELLDAIANWPDGGSCYGQENIKAFVIANREG
jgi:hypothetical protein